MNAASRRSHHPAAMWSQRDGSSPNLDMYVDNVDQSYNYFARHGMKPPPLVSRSARRKLQSNNDDETTTTTSGLDHIMEETKLGNDAVTRLRRDLFEKSSYDKHAYPFEYTWYGMEEGSRTGVPIELDIAYRKVFAVDTINSVLDMIVWFRMQWFDPRLTWDPTEYGNMTKIWAWIGDGGVGGETSEIWTPDIELWNPGSGLSETLTDAHAIVNHNGLVYWTRPGHLRPTCKFEGLNKFPFDQLTCKVEFGSWTHSGKYTRLVLGGIDGDGVDVLNSFTAGSTYNEFKFVEKNPVSCKEHVYPPFPASPEEDWPVILCDVTVGRSWQPYARGYILLQIMLNIIGFAAFWLPPSCGERMGLSITAMLASVAAELVVAAKLPASAELTWFQKFSITSLMFSFISLMECVAVLYFFYKRTDTLMPRWYNFAKEWYLVRQAQKGKDVLVQKGSNIVDTISSGVDTFADSVKSKSTIQHQVTDLSENVDIENSPNASKPVDVETAKRINLSDSSVSISNEDFDFEKLNASFQNSSSTTKPPEGINPRPKEIPAKPYVRFSFKKDEEREDEEREDDHDRAPPRRRNAINIPARRASFQSWIQESGSVMMPRDANDVSSYFTCLGLDNFLHLLLNVYLHISLYYSSLSLCSFTTNKN